MGAAPLATIPSQQPYGMLVISRWEHGIDVVTFVVVSKHQLEHGLSPLGTLLV